MQLVKVKSGFSMYFCFYTMSILYCLKILIFSWFFFLIFHSAGICLAYSEFHRRTLVSSGDIVDSHHDTGTISLCGFISVLLYLCYLSCIPTTLMEDVCSMVLETKRCFSRWVEQPEAKYKLQDTFVWSRWHIQILQKLLWFFYHILVYFWLQL